MDSAKPRRVRLGTRDMMFPSGELQELTDSTHLLGNRDALLQQLDQIGYLLIRGLHDRNEVLEARKAVIKYIKDSGDNRFKEGTDIDEGILDQRCGLGCIPYMEGRNDISHSEEVLRVIEGPRVKKFFRTLFNEEPRTLDFKWLRGMHVSGFTGAHVDRVYMNWGTDDLYTIWTPMDDVPVEMGVLAMCEGSHSLESFRHFQETYGSMDAEKDCLKGTGWFTCDPLEICEFGGQWKTTDFRAGDVMVFPMRTVHMSTVNMTDKVRISCDTRWQAASQPADPRYVDEFKRTDRVFGVHVDLEQKSADEMTIEEFKTKWGFVEKGKT